MAQYTSTLYQGSSSEPKKTKPYDYGQPYVDLSVFKSQRNKDVIKRVQSGRLYKLKKYKAKPLYRCTELYGEDRKHLPYDYAETLLSKMLSPYIYRKRDVSGFLDFINDWIVTLLQGVGKLKILKNFTVDKDYKYIK